MFGAKGITYFWGKKLYQIMISCLVQWLVQVTKSLERKSKGCFFLGIPSKYSNILFYGIKYVIKIQKQDKIIHSLNTKNQCEREAGTGKRGKQEFYKCKRLSYIKSMKKCLKQTRKNYDETHFLWGAPQEKRPFNRQFISIWRGV